MRELEWSCKGFYELSLDELYEILFLRQEVFVVEQDCPYIDADGKDQKSLHLAARLDGKLVAYTRLLPTGYYYDDAAAIGRVITAASVRKHGYGVELMERSVSEIHKRFNNPRIRLSGQCYLKKFYRKFGFEEVGEEYLEDGIPHIEMVREA